MNGYLMEHKNLKECFAPVDLNTAGAVGARIKLDKTPAVAVVLHIGTSLAGGVVDVTLKQHNAASAGTSKVLSVAKKYYKKVGAATEFTMVEPSVAASNYVLSTDFDTDGGIVVFEIEEADLDINNGFAWFSVDLADGGVAKLASGLYAFEPEFKPAYAQTI